MGRVKIALPEKFGFETTLSVRVGDLNYGNHMGNDALLTLAHEARIRWLKANGCTELDCFGTGIIMKDVMAVYTLQGFHGDRLTVRIAIDDIRGFSFDFLYHFLCQGKEVARVKTGMLFFDYTKQQPAAIPEEFIKRFTDNTGNE